MTTGKTHAASPFIQMVLFAILCICASVPAFSEEPADSYSTIQDVSLKNSFVEALSSAGVSSTENLVSFHEPAPLADGTDEQVHVHVVQDRGLPGGAEYPTYVFRTAGGVDEPALIYRTNAGTRLYTHSDIVPDSGCVISAKAGYSDICLADAQGNAAPELPGLRKDFWSDLIRLFGL
ncbi:hypothetical protein [uncultured Roseibium sp.]|uniref:hypothetical protein n=1 Tax=uncultured Roseibium sp. TaxID=1936171 RepID=UPI0026222DB2|nr:hypothetical protein [uncultured Roseibium sp.]